MALLQDIEKASEVVGKHRGNCNNEDAFTKIADKMKECLKASLKMEKLLDDLADEVKKGDLAELTKDQQREFDAAEKAMAAASVYVLWNGGATYCENFSKDHMKVVEALKRIK